jgi:hypothetical protein
MGNKMEDFLLFMCIWIPIFLIVLLDGDGDDEDD